MLGQIVNSGRRCRGFARRHIAQCHETEQGIFGRGTEPGWALKLRLNQFLQDCDLLRQPPEKTNWRQGCSGARRRALR